MEINILMAVDKNFISQARVTIWSARKYTDARTKLFVTILCSKDLDQKSKDRILVLESIWEKLSIRFYEVDERDFSEAYKAKDFPVVASYRLVAAKIMKTSKCIYLDSDLIVSLDLNDLYQIDISDFYIGGVVDMGLILSPNLAYEHLMSCKIKDYSDYVNSGVLLMNLEKMRKEHLVEKLLSEIKQNMSPWPDQDAINKVCHGKIYLIDWTFNHVVSYSDKDYLWQWGRSKREGRGEIYHWNTSNKPWDNYALRQAKIWWQVAKEALEPEVYQECYRIADKHMRQMYFSEIVKKCNAKKEIVIVGFSNHGMCVMRYLRKCGITGKIIFCDNDRIKRKMCLPGSIVLSVEEAAAKHKSAIWINAVQNAREKVNSQINSLGISLNQILEYYAKCSEDYFMLDTEHMIKGINEKTHLHK